MQKLVRRIEQHKLKQQLFNRISPWDVLTCLPSAPYTVLGEAMAMQASQNPHDSNTSDTTTLKGSYSLRAPEYRRTLHLTLSWWEPAGGIHCTTALRPAPQLIPTARTHSPVLDNATQPAVPDGGRSLHDLTPSLLPQFDQPDLVLHATALRMWVEQKAATCAAAAAAAAWNIVCGHAAAACVRGRVSGILPAAASLAPSSPESRLAPARPPGGPSSSPSVLHGTQTCVCHVDSNSNHSDMPAPPSLLQADDLLRVYAAQQQHKVCSQPTICTLPMRLALLEPCECVMSLLLHQVYLSLSR